MRRLALGLGLSLALAAPQALAQQPAKTAPAKQENAKPAPASKTGASKDKLPIELPSVTIRGEDESVAPLKGGSKLAPLDPHAPLSQLPVAPNAKQPGALELAIETIRPEIRPASESLPVPRTEWTELELGVGALYELGVFHGREIAGAVTESELALDSAWPWLRARLGVDATWNQATAGLGLRHVQEDLVGGDRLLIQSMELGGNWQRDDLLTDGALDFGWVQAPASNNNGLLQDQSSWTRALKAGATWKPQGLEGHLPELSATLGHRETDRRSDATAYLRAFDHWTIDPRWSVEAALGGGLFVGMPVLDPMARVSFRPDDPTEISVALMTTSDMPDFEELYLSRRLVVGNGGLLPSRSDLVATLSGSHRLNDLWHAFASVDYRRVSRYMIWEDPEQDGLWQPTNSAANAPQDVMSALLSGTYQIGDVGSQRFHYRIEGAQPLGIMHQEAGALHQRVLIRDRLTVEAGASIVLDQLSAAQTAGVAGSGWQIVAQAGANLRLTDRIGLYGKVQDWPLATRQPSLNYYAPFGLALVGARVEF